MKRTRRVALAVVAGALAAAPLITPTPAAAQYCQPDDPPSASCRCQQMQKSVYKLGIPWDCPQ